MSFGAHVVKSIIVLSGDEQIVIVTSSRLAIVLPTTVLQVLNDISFR